MEINYRKILYDNGYCIIKNFFNSEEFNKLRKFILNHNDKNCDIYLRANDQLNFNLLSDRYFQLLKRYYWKRFNLFL